MILPMYLYCIACKYSDSLLTLTHMCSHIGAPCVERGIHSSQGLLARRLLLQWDRPPRKGIAPLARRWLPSRGEVCEYWQGSFTIINSAALCGTNPQATSPRKVIAPLARRVLPSEVDCYPCEEPSWGAAYPEGVCISYVYSTYFNNILSIHRLYLVSWHIGM